MHYQCFVACDRGWELECSWCFGTGWDTSAAFAPNQSAALAAIADIRAILDDLS